MKLHCRGTQGHMNCAYGECSWRLRMRAVCADTERLANHYARQPFVRAIVVEPCSGDLPVTRRQSLS